MVSGSISFPSRGAFHLSLTVLVHYRSAGYLALGRGRPRFPPGSSCPVVLKDFNHSVLRVSSTGLSPSMVGLSRHLLLPARFVTEREPCQLSTEVLQPLLHNAAPITCKRFRLLPVRSPLLRELFLFLGVLRCFSSPAYPPYIKGPTHHGRGLPHSEISGSVCKRLPGAYRSVTTSFIGPVCQGIHHLLLFTCANLSILRLPPSHHLLSQCSEPVSPSNKVHKHVL